VAAEISAEESLKLVDPGEVAVVVVEEIIEQ
jgi:hypothetical protein